MSQLYDKVTRPADRPKRLKNSKWLFLLLAAAAVILLVWVLSVYGTLSLRPRFYDFVSDLSNSTTYAYEHNTLRAEADGAAARVTGDNAYAFYHALSVASPSKFLRSPPKEPASLTLDYGDGSRLQLWPNLRPDGQATYGLSLYYENADGTRYLFQFKSANIYPLLQYVSLTNNEPWED